MIAIVNPAITSLPTVASILSVASLFDEPVLFAFSVCDGEPVMRRIELPDLQRAKFLIADLRRRPTEDADTVIRSPDGVLVLKDFGHRNSMISTMGFADTTANPALVSMSFHAFSNGCAADDAFDLHLHSNNEARRSDTDVTYEAGNMS
jgi:hypothetical protein